MRKVHSARSIPRGLDLFCRMRGKSLPHPLSLITCNMKFLCIPLLDSLHILLPALVILHSYADAALNNYLFICLLIY